MNGFPDNARVCFLGDSITHNNEFVSRISAYYHENLRERNVNFYNCGVSGGGIYTLLKIFDEDIIIRKPTHAVIMIGINDSGRDLLNMPRGEERYRLLLEHFDNYKKNLALLTEKLLNNNVEIILCTPTPYDEYQTSDVPALPGGFALISAYADYVRRYASEHGFKLCDYNKYISETAQCKAIISPDRVHPNEDGHYCMAKCFLAFQGYDIGEQKPIPEYMDEWREKTVILRGIHAAEHMVISDYSLSVDERIEKAHRYIESGGDGPHREYFLFLSDNYIKYKPIQKQLLKEIDELMEISFKK